MERTAVAPQASSQVSQLQFLGTDTAGVAGIEGDALESSDEEANRLPFPDAENQPPSDEASSQLHDNNRKLRAIYKKLEQRKKKFQNLLKVYQKKEMEFVAQMDSHMDEVEHTEHALSLKIESLSAENHQLRTFNEKRERENSELAERLTETTKQCSESETRVQFLVDRIVALLQSGSADQAQTEQVVSMRQREREMLRQLEETRSQFDEVRQQNGELHSRLTEELSLSRRLQEQLVEVEERFSKFQQQRSTGDAGFPGVNSSLQSAGLEPATNLPSSSAMGELSMPPRGAGRLGPRPMGLRSDQTEAPPERERQPLPELPPPISEVGEASEPSQMEAQSTALGQIAEGEILESGDEELSGEQPLVEGAETVPDNDLAAASQAMSSSGSLDDSGLTRVQQGARALPTIFKPNPPRPTPAPKPAPEKPLYSRTTSAEGVLMMEQKLREALDRASFECAVVRIENGIYNFGPTICAVVELTADNEVVACQQDSSEFVPIDDFIRGIAQRPGSMQQGPLGGAGAMTSGPPSSSSTSWPPAGAAGKASPVDNTVSQTAAAGEGSVERRMFGPPAKAAQSTYPSGSPPTLPTTLSGHGAVSSTSPRRVAPVVQSGASAVPPSVARGRQGAGITPERARVLGQPSPGAGYPGGQPTSQAGQRMISPNTGGALRYGASQISPGRQGQSTAPVYQQGALTSPRIQG